MNAGAAVLCLAATVYDPSGSQAPPSPLERGLGLLERGDAEGAVRELRAAVTASPGEAAVNDALGIALAEAGSGEAAAEAFREATRLDPSLAAAWFHLGVVLDRLGRGLEAVAAYESALRLERGSVEARYGLSIVLAKLGDLDGTIELLREVIAARPGFAEAHYDLGLYLWSRHRAGGGLPRPADLDAAESALRQAVQLGPERPKPRLALGQLLAERQRLDEALFELRQAAMRGGSDPAYAYDLGLALRLQGDLDGAEQQLRAALALDPRHGEARRALGLILRQKGELEAAAIELKASVAERPADAQGHNVLGTVLVRLGDVETAIGAFRRAIELEATLVEAHVNLAQALNKAGRKDDARAALAEVRRLKQREAGLGRAMLLLGAAGRQLAGGQAHVAVVSLREAVAAAPDLAEAHYQLGRALLSASPASLAEAEDALLQAVLLDPRRARYRYEWARLLAARGDLVGAADQMRQATQLQPSLFEAQRELGLLALRAGDFRAATSAFMAALAWRDTDAELHLQLATALDGVGEHAAAAEERAAARRHAASRRYDRRVEHRRHVTRSATAAALVVSLAGLASQSPAQQGMASPTRPVRRVKPIESSLPPITLDFHDVAAEAGLVASNVSGAEDRKRYILEATGGGVALFDYDGDGRLDVFVTSGTTLDPDPATSGATSRLYRNLGGLRFEDATQPAGLARVGWGQGVCVGDYDNDGQRDLFVAYYGQSVLYRNEGGGRFRDVTQAAGLETAVRWDSGCTFLDYDLDGRLDLFVSSYLEFDRSRIPEPGSGSYCLWKGVSVMCGPRGLPFSRNRLLRNLGDGRFEDVSERSGIAAAKSCYGFTAVASDFDDDGHPDVYIACDSTPSLLFRNLGNGTFEEVGLLSGAGLNESGQEQGGMGVAVADYDEDGHFDIVKTNFSDDVPNVYWNHGDATFEDRVFEAGLGAYMSYVGWGVHLIDVDHDGRRDLLMTNGHVYPEADQIPDVDYRQPHLLYRNVGGGRFKDISSSSGPGIRERWSSRGSAAGDLDGDGTLEIVVNNLGARPSLLKNLAPQKNWLLVRCVGVKSNRDAIGARVYVHVGDRRLSGEVQGGTSFVSQDDSRLHFGLGSDASYARVEVLWPGGAREVFAGGAVNRVVVVEQGQGSPAPRP